METISVDVNGKTSSYNNFTKVDKGEPELIRGKKVDTLKFEDGLVGSEEASKKSMENLKKKKKSLKKKKKKKTKKSKKSNKSKKHKSKSTKKASKKSSKKSNINQFPKIILYQGPISKALENMLNVQSTPSRQLRQLTSDIPMTFEQATADIKRSNIERAPSKLEEEDEDEDDDNDFELDMTKFDKKSKLAKGKSSQQRKYSVKGYSDGKLDRKSLQSKKSKSEGAKKKYFVSSSNNKRKDFQLKTNGGSSK